MKNHSKIILIIFIGFIFILLISNMNTSEQTTVKETDDLPINEELAELMPTTSEAEIINNENQEAQQQTTSFVQITPDDFKSIIINTINEFIDSRFIKSLDKIIYVGDGRFEVEATDENWVESILIGNMYETMQKIADQTVSPPNYIDFDPVIYMRFNSGIGSGYIESTTSWLSLQKIYNKEMSRSDWQDASNFISTCIPDSTCTRQP